MNKPTIRKFNPTAMEDHQTWKQLNLQWLRGYDHHEGTLPYLLEEGDFKTLDDPVKNIIQTGGQIWFAETRDPDISKTVGTIGLMRHHEEWEIIKLAVLPEFQGQGIGKLLINTVVDYAKQLRINRLVLDSNSQLTTAIRLYKKFGFQTIPARGHFATADVAMELILASRS